MIHSTFTIFLRGMKNKWSSVIIMVFYFLLFKKKSLTRLSIIWRDFWEFTKKYFLLLNTYFSEGRNLEGKELQHIIADCTWNYISRMFVIYLHILTSKSKIYHKKYSLHNQDMTIRVFYFSKKLDHIPFYFLRDWVW